MPYCDHGRENLCFDLFKLNRRFEHITHKKAVVVEISMLRIIQCRKGRGVMVQKDSFWENFVSRGGTLVGCGRFLILRHFVGIFREMQEG